VPWREATVKEQRAEFVRLARAESANVSELCRRFGISRKTGYKLIKRWQQEGDEGLDDRSCRPKTSPARTAAPLEQQVLEVRTEHPAWGARKIAYVLQRDRGVELATSTVNSILRRHGRISQAASEAATGWQRFEHDKPNELWQMDFKGHFALDSGRCHPLTVLDDHSRYNLVLQASHSESFEFVQNRLQSCFERYGLPRRINTDNGAPWRMPGQPIVTRLGLWLIHLGIRLSHSRPAHPQTNGKDERFHRSLKAEALGTRRFADMHDAQRCLDAWRHVYNHQRPHQALQMQTPSERYAASPRAMPKTLPPIEYGPDDIVRKVQAGGYIHFQGREIRLYESLRGLPIALRPTSDRDGVYDLYFCHQRLYEIDLSDLS